MIYCKLKNKNSESAVYFFGNSIGDITGEAEFYSSFVQPQILKLPNTGSISDNLLSKIAVKYKEKLLNGDFPERMSYER